MSRKLVSFDWAMKKILRQKANFGILEGFLSELFRFDIKIEEILESEANQDSEDDKFNRVDLLAKDEYGELILIEVQYDGQQDYFHRMLYGASKLICDYMEKSDEYQKVKKVYSVNIVYFALAKGSDYLYYGKTQFEGMNQENEIFKLSNHQQKQFGIKEVHQIFPEYYVIRVNKFDDIVKNSIDEWIYFLKNEKIKDNFKAKGLDEANDILDVMKLPEEAKAIYDRKIENKRYKKSLLHSARIEGENKRNIEIAKNLLNANIDIKVIVQTTGLSMEEIEKLK
ncbi:MAG: Rpn family recombination-promoting nuclease/putative transposase [Sulfurovum sp.]|nr:Rpn family recombination-promoting nuclease/putative transposase [Sulfurovum sp.]